MTSNEPSRIEEISAKKGGVLYLTGTRGTVGGDLEKTIFVFSDGSERFNGGPELNSHYNVTFTTKEDHLTVTLPAAYKGPVGNGLQFETNVG